MADGRWPARTGGETRTVFRGGPFTVGRGTDRLGEPRGSHPVAGLGGGLAQLARRLVIGLCVALVVALVYARPSAAFAKGAVATAVVLTLLGLTQAWRRVAARYGLARCYLYTGGLVVTNVFGRVRDALAWSEVAGLNRLSNQSPLLAFHRFELVRRGSPPLAFLALGMNPALVEALLNEAARNDIR